MAALKQENQIWHPHIVPALDALIGAPDMLRPEKQTKRKADTLYIPEIYIDKVEAFRDELSSRGEASKNILGYFTDILGAIHNSSEMKDGFICDNGMIIKFMSPSLLRAMMFRLYFLLTSSCTTFLPTHDSGTGTS